MATNRNPFVVTGTNIPPMKGRKNVFDRVIRSLTKPTPDHISITGPERIGKTVLINAVAEHFCLNNDFYNGIISWDFKHNTPHSDIVFFRDFTRKLKDCIGAFDSELASYLSGNEAETRKDVFVHLAGKSQRILLLIDGLDSLMEAENITKVLWDNLRELAQYSSLRVVIGSRRNISEICSKKASWTSDFWNIITEFIELKAFEKKEINEFLHPLEEKGIRLTGLEFEAIHTWSGGAPLLLCALANELYDSCPNEINLSISHIDYCAKNIIDGRVDVLYSLWSKCDEEEKNILNELVEKKTILSRDITFLLMDSLVKKGYVIEEKGQLSLSCRFVEEYLKRIGHNNEALRRYFESPEQFIQNSIFILEMRLNQIKEIDRALVLSVKKAIEYYGELPTNTLGLMRQIEENALKFIWNRELPDRTVPLPWIEGWERKHSRISEEIRNGLLPGVAVQQIRLLDLLTDSREPGETRVSRSSYILINYLHDLGNLGQHSVNEDILPSFAFSACITATQLCENLSHDFS